MQPHSTDIQEALSPDAKRIIAEPLSYQLREADRFRECNDRLSYGRPFFVNHTSPFDDRRRFAPWCPRLGLLLGKTKNFELLNHETFKDLVHALIELWIDVVMPLAQPGLQVRLGIPAMHQSWIFATALTFKDVHVESTD